MGCAYQRMNNLQLAERCLLQASEMCPQDPAVAHELGVLAYRWGGSGFFLVTWMQFLSTVYRCGLRGEGKGC